MTLLKRSFAPVVFAGTRLLMLGSLPGDRSLAERRYYAHPQNQFWRLMAPVVGCEALPRLPYDRRLDTLTTAGVGLWDVVARAERRGSADAAIQSATANDLAALVSTLPKLRAVAFNGGKAAAIGQPLLAGAPLALIALPSSSPLHTIGLDAKQAAWLALREWL